MSSEDPTILYGEIALREGLLKREQLDEAIRIQENSPGNPPLGEILCDLGFLTPQQHSKILDLQRQALQSPSPSSGDTRVRRRLDNLFGKLAVSLGFAAPSEINECIRLQAKEREAGNKVPLGRLLVDKAYLEEAQVLAILSIQENQIVGCPPCGKWYRAEQGKVPTTCKHCGNPLRPATEMGALDPRDLLAGAAETMAGPGSAPPDVTQYVDETKRSLPAVGGGFGPRPAGSEGRGQKPAPTHLGRLAVELGLITQVQLDECLALQRRSQPPKPLGRILQERGYLAPEQVTKLLAEQERRIGRESGLPAHVARRTQIGELAVQQGFLNREDLNRLLREQAQNSEAGYKQSLGRVLLDKGVLTPKHLDHLTRRQRRMRRIASVRGRASSQAYAVYGAIAAALLLGAVFILSSHPKAASPVVTSIARRPVVHSEVSPPAVTTAPENPVTESPVIAATEGSREERNAEPRELRREPGGDEDAAAWEADIRALRSAAEPAPSPQAEQSSGDPTVPATADAPAAVKPVPIADPEENRLARKVVEDGPEAAGASEALSRRSIGDPRALDLLLLRAQDHFNATREFRLRALAAVGGTKTDEVKASLVERAGEEPDAGVRLRVVRMLQSMWPDRTTLCFLLNVLKVDRDEPICRAILGEVAAGQAKDVYVQDVLAELVGDESFPAPLRISAVDLLSGPGKGRKEIRETLAQQAVFGKPPAVAKACGSALAGIGRDEAARLIEAEKQTGPPDRRAAAKAPGNPPVDTPLASRFVPALLFWKREDKKPDRIVIHTVEGTKNGTLSWFKNPQSRASAHYLVGFDGEVIQIVREADAAQHLWWQPWNQTSFGIEHEGYAAKNEWREAQYRASAALVRDLCRRYRIPADVDHIVSHAVLNPKERYDPGPYFDWNYYLALVRGEKNAKRSILPPNVKLPPEAERRQRIRTLLWRHQAADRAKRYGESNDALVELAGLVQGADLAAYVSGRQQAYRSDAGIARQLVRHEDLKLAEGCRDFVKTFLAWGQVKTARRCVDAQLERVTTEEARKKLKAQIADIEAVKREIDRKGYFEIDPTLVTNFK